MEKLKTMTFETNKEFALALDRTDPLSKWRDSFHIPKTKDGIEQIYLTGHSLGLMPKKVEEYIQESLETWSKLGVKGHTSGNSPWVSYHELLSEDLAWITGAKTNEVVAMNSLTVNLHLMLTSFYQPRGKKNKILIENTIFSSDRYAIDSHVKLHGYDPHETVISLNPDRGKLTISPERILNQIRELKESLALVVLGNVNYLTGQHFPIKESVQASHEIGAYIGFNLAHGIGNIRLQLHEDDVDFAVWCGYKYLNSGPGGIAGAFVHNRFAHTSLPRLEGWWGHDKAERFLMKPKFKPIGGAETWQLSNPPIFQLAAQRASLEIFRQANRDHLFCKRETITSYLEFLLKKILDQQIEIITPKDRGSMLCLRIKDKYTPLTTSLSYQNEMFDFREPDILRLAPVPLYTRYIDVFHAVEKLNNTLNKKNE